MADLFLPVLLAEILAPSIGAIALAGWICARVMR